MNDRLLQHDELPSLDDDLDDESGDPLAPDLFEELDFDEDKEREYEYEDFDPEWDEDLVDDELNDAPGG